MKNKKGIRISILTYVVMLATIFAVALPVNAIAITITVPDDYPTIQGAIDAACPWICAGDIVYVRAGTYYENLSITKPLTLQGEDRETTIIDGNGSGNVIYINFPMVTVKGLTIRNGNCGIYKNIQAYDRIKIEDCKFLNNNTGFYGNNLFRSPISNCEFAYNTNGLSLSNGGSSCLIANNEVHDNDGTGISLSVWSDSVVEKNKIWNNNGYGIYNGGGGPGSNNVIRENVVRNNGKGIYIGKFQQHNQIYHNDVIDNTIQVEDGRGTSSYDNGYPSGGNYWSDYYGEDNYSGVNQDVPGSDGIGDTPYEFIGGWSGYQVIQDRYPLMSPFNIADSDGDGTLDHEDNCPTDFNPDQSNVDGDLKGDACDVCPNDATDSCDQGGSAGGSIGSDGGSISTPDNSVTFDAPEGALGDDTSISITDEIGDSGLYELTTNLGSATAHYAVNIQPAGTTFGVPVTIMFSWLDSDNDGKIDGTNFQEPNLIITKDDVALTDRCRHESGCDMAANTFTFQVSSLSKFALCVLNAAAIDDISGPVDPRQVNTAINFSATFTYPNSNYTHIASWGWGDGEISLGTVLENGGSGSAGGTYTYTAAGVYTVSLTVSDGNDSGSANYQYVVVYDPDGGFVTGGGWIDSPPEAYTPDLSLTGKATFGFVSKYKKGAITPTGQTEFQFRVADLNFHSDTYQWMVIAGARAQYKGTGTINGGGNFSFMLTAIDGALPGGGGSDKFRMKIWDMDAGGAIVYDNQMDAADDAEPTTTIGGGSIVIHKK